MRTIKTRIFSCLLAVMLAIPAFSMSALAAGTDPEAAESIPTTGGIEFDAPETDSDLSPEDTTEEDAPESDTEETEASVDTAAILSELLGKLNITATENGVQITSGDADGSAASQTGTVTTGGSNLNVRTGAGTENPAITQLPSGTQVEVIGTEGGWYKIRLPEREGYVCGDYLTVSETVGGDGSFSLSLTEEEMSERFYTCMVTRRRLFGRQRPDPGRQPDADRRHWEQQPGGQTVHHSGKQKRQRVLLDYRPG